MTQKFQYIFIQTRSAITVRYLFSLSSALVSSRKQSNKRGANKSSADLPRTVLFEASKKMVRLHVKKGEESQFLYDTHVEARVEDVVYDITIIYNGRLKISRICYGNDPSPPRCFHKMSSNSVQPANV